MAWLLPALTLLVGITIGFIAARLLPSATYGRTQRQLDELQERFDTYQNEVIAHFNTTASLVKKLTQSYTEIQQHLSEGANHLALDELTRQRMLATVQNEEARDNHEHLSRPAPPEAPKDYAPKIANAPGMLDEQYGLKGRH